MRILFLQKRAGSGGSKESLLATLHLLSGAGHEVFVLCSEEGYFTSRLKERGIPFLIAYVPEYRKLPDRLRFGRHIARIAAGLPPGGFDWIISNEMWWAPAAAALAEKTGMHSAAILRDTLTGPEKLRKYDLQSLGRVLCVNPVMTGWVNGIPGAEGKAHTVFNPVALPDAVRERREHWQSVIDAWPGVDRVLVTVGSLGPRKNQLDALRVLHCLGKHSCERAGLILAGNGERGYVSGIRQTARELSLSKRLLMPGHIAGVRELMEASDCFVLTSLREGLPRSVIEALLAGVPAFSYPLPGLEAIYGGCHDRFVAAQPDPSELARTIAAGLDSPWLDGAVSTLQERAGERFSGKRHLETLLSVLEGRDGKLAPHIS